MSDSPLRLGLIESVLDVVHERVVGDVSGHVADYIPELADADPEPFGIALCSVNGGIYSTGDDEVAFTIQSISKPFVYALALSDIGVDAVHAHVGTEPSGDAFNAISVEEDTGRPPNPMVNAGAIMTSSLVAGDTHAERIERVVEWLSRFAGRRLRVDESLYTSERSSGDRNRALAYLMKSAGSLTADVEDTLDLYFLQCSVLVTARDLAVMAATLANNGSNPVTGDQVISESVCEHVLTIMATCGMYDSAGEWLMRVGLPAKSGVAGGLIASSPGEFGLGVFSPRLDASGNTVRGVQATERLADRFGLHVFNRPRQVGWRSSLVDPAGGGTRDVDGKQARESSAEAERDARALLAERGSELMIWRFRGYTDFASVESMYVGFDNWRNARDDPSAPATVVMDFSGVTQVQDVAVDMLAAFALWGESVGVEIAAHDPYGQGDAIRGLAMHSALAEAARSSLAREHGLE